MIQKNDPKIIVALDYDSIEQAQAFIKQIDPQLCRLKVGNILFTRYGPTIIEKLMQAGFQVFLDLKFHDIPQTVAGACRAAAALGVWMVNLHISGGKAMMLAAREMIDSCKQKPLLIGVTVLTSLLQNDLGELGIHHEMKSLVEIMAFQAQTCGLDGVVCSSHEVAMLREKLGNDFLLVTPGIRLENDVPDDQKRVMTPNAAICVGSSYLVIGRSITKSKDPLNILTEINAAL